jgi:hypothetical protein
MDGFRFGKSRPSSIIANPTSTPTHARSHSRNNSIVSASTSNFSVSTSHDSLITTSSKRSSHHRRQSSVSTRRESAEVMGVSLAHIPTSLSDSDNISLGDKDSIRRRALMALEGKSDVGAFSKVEIPDFDLPAPLKKPFELRASQYRFRIA